MAYGDLPKGIPSAAPVNFTQGEYAVDNLSYPNDLMSDANQYGGNYVIFYVNVHEDSFLVKGDTSGKGFVQGNTPRRVESAASGLTATGAAGGVIGGAAIAGQVTNVAGNAARAVGANLTAVGGTVANVATGALLGGATILAVGGPKADYRRMTSAIALHVPNELSVRYSAQWEAESMTATLAMAAVAENTGKAIGSLGSMNVKEAWEAIKGTGGAIAGSLTAAALQTPGAGQLLQKTSGTAANPKKEQLFQEVDFRTFTFAYQFFPRSKEEAKNIQNIIKTFKLHMHPEYRPGSNQFLFIYPSEFDIIYFQNGKENLNLHRHTTSVLTDMSVSYSPQGQFASFDDGMPTQINVVLTFKELAQLTKETINVGF